MRALRRGLYGDNIIAGGRSPRVSGLPGSLTALLRVWYERSRQRHALRRLDRRLLRDIGIGWIEAEREYRKPFWLP